MRRIIMLPALCLALSGCIYSHTIEPLMTDFNATPVGSERNSGGIKTVAFYVSVEWDENGIGTIAKQHGIEEIYFADIETIMILGYWQQQRVHIYGR
ncbi:MAG TPA: hypothetical protein QF499_12545 [Gammaproteobacteria bacterium]|nr:hypothetical protein [Gammaproteobacteria bacterium]HJP39939.1 hypothetical protein [Gammaproteobacteria bacterium]